MSYLDSPLSFSTKVTRDDAASIIRNAPNVTISVAAEAFAAPGDVPRLALSTYGGDVDVLNVEKINANTYRVTTQIDRPFGDYHIRTMHGGHPLIVK
ncbi:hypothetical protein [Salinibacter phage M8CRM-1]|uniref:Uncharacterized protein n=3 Tax=Kryptosalinivirus TaxID=2560163 RepID=A0A2I6UGB7_9CAUD|nr:hypothetical protein FGG63_gp70 [Salinibacter phage M8CC-19]YP_009639535.1 hypothetical protein FGG67_gp69 [Salinibacter phage M8CRM-1]AUO79001.1 hypothetical protein [Salinibacter phage M8CC-19]AUO79161.1 hypothetical protein [Salinibacter phage M8CRM-1]AUO79234.1 hypothetical protein [Salinibacter phage M31CC-1]